MNPFDYNHPPDAPASGQLYIATVKPFDAVSPSDHQPLARVRYTNGKTFVGRDTVRHIDVHRETGQPVEHWMRIDGYAREIVSQISTLVADGAVSPVACFTELRYHLDADTGWSPAIDALSDEDWAAVQWRVTDLLRTG
ncbi:hypothetical protein A5731_27370 [Mycolicibacterium conceptionense]|jgi:hypothetical protein|uniref:Uncharacterized protein n=1 Tax=Mycolicibacterium conceptionense TaxID=451644 RepID=A0A1A1VIR1_9MYCO|nr:MULTISPECIES: hypothetical protein [Mycobacteriaceae]MCF6391260.1 hypothetical protein [Mycobacterium sp. MBM]OBB07013.1 hypothetical protein A5718_18595 [Mycolicibacterium conceptionense]OBE94588.1 hypothetical protein A5731_27370 [Mycolicibacterium conceptionense]OBF21789.1 hypothetical protein A5726_14635 [Mycolicibacterium conceptionense]OBF33943.1 hypothetical protein A5720_24650 [Mycolicibacterium conceptionense]